MAEVLAAIGGIGAVIGVVDPIVNRIQQIVARCRVFSDNPEALDNLSRDYAFVKTELKKVRNLLFDNSFAPSANTQLSRFEPTVNRIKQNFKLAEPRLLELENLFPPASAQHPRRIFDKIEAKSRQFAHAKQISSCINALATLVAESNGYLSSLNGFLTLAEKIDVLDATVRSSAHRAEQAAADVSLETTRMEGATARATDAATQMHHAAGAVDAIGRTMENANASITGAAVEISSAVGSVQQVTTKLDNTRIAIDDAIVGLQHSHFTRRQEQEEFKPRYLVPPMSRDIVLDFSTCDEHGNSVTMEGKLKDDLQSIKTSPERSAPVTVAVGVAGMGGVGKTCALVGLGWEEDLRNHFTGGIYFIPIGKDARVENIVVDIATIVDASGGVRAAIAVRNAENLSAAIGKASQWFQGHSVLFLCDDIWETVENPVGYLKHLRQLLTTSPASRMVISTRSRNIALDSGKAVHFAPRLPEGDESLDILLRYVDTSRVDLEAAPKTCSDALASVLRQCGGLPLTLAVAGRAIREITFDCAGGWAEAVEVYSADLGSKIASVSSEPIGDYPNFDATVHLSVQMVDQWTKKRDLRKADGTPLCCFESFNSMCVFRRQTAIPLFTLKKLWRLADDRILHQVLRKLKDLNLVTWRRGGANQSSTGCIGLHDLILDYCQRQAVSRLVCYHYDLLNEYAEAGESLQNYPITDVMQRLSSKDSVQSSLRSWWNLPSDGYIHENLCRHLSLGESTPELIALLCDVRWAAFRVTYGGLLAWLTDFELASVSLRRGKSASNDEVKWNGAIEGLRRIQTAALDAWSLLRSNPADLSFQMQSRLCDAPSSLWPVSCFLKSINRYLKQFIRSVTRCWPAPGGSPCSDMFVGQTESYSKAWSVDFSKDGRLAVVASGTGVLVLSLETKDTVHHLNGESGFVSCVAITFDGKYVASGSQHGFISMWDAITGNVYGEPWDVASPYDRNVSVQRIAICAGGHRIASSQKGDSVKVWHMTNGVEERHVNLIGTENPEVLQFGAGGERVFVLSRDGKMEIFSATTGVQERTIVPEVETYMATCVATSEQGTVILRGHKNGTIELLRSVKKADRTYGTRECVLVGHSDWVTCLAISDGAGLIVSGSDDHTLRLWDAASGKPVGAPLRGHEDGIACVSISEDGKRIISISVDNNMKMWELNGRVAIEEEATQHDAPIICVAISEDAKYAVSASGDRTLRMWNVVTGEAIGTPRIFLAIKLEAFDGIVRSYGEGGLQCWKIDGDEGLVKHGELMKDSEYYELPDEELGEDKVPGNSQLKMWDIQCSQRKVMGTRVGMDKAVQLATLPSKVCQGAGIMSWQYAEYESPRIEEDGLQVFGVVVAGLKNGRVVFLELVDQSGD